MNENKISVIVPVYNIENYIEKTVESIRNQTYKNLEIILVDDGSSDNSGRILDKIADKDSRIQVLHQEGLLPLFVWPHIQQVQRGLNQ